MSAKSIREYDGKCILAHWLNRAPAVNSTVEYKTPSQVPATKLAAIAFPSPSDFTTEDKFDEAAYAARVEEILNNVEKTHSWVKTDKLVAKPDMLIKRRGKAGLLCLNKDWTTAREWIRERAGKDQKVEHLNGYLTQFLVEPFVPHESNTEYYICINSVREGDWILFTHEGGVDVGDVDAKAAKILIPVDLASFPSRETLISTLLSKVPADVHDVLADFIMRLYAVYVDSQFTYLEINPLVVIPTSSGAEVHYLDLAAKLDQTAEFESGTKWAIARSNTALGLGTPSDNDHGPEMEWPGPFGREKTKEESYIADLDAKTGASLKLTVLNPKGRVWTLVAGGGASVVYADAIASAGYADELANYGEYSGAPTETQTYEYAKTVFDLMTRAQPNPAKPLILFIGGGIANFTNTKKTFDGIIRALGDYATALKAHGTQIWVRRAGPNYQEALKAIRACSEALGLEMQVYGPEMHVSGIIPMAFKAPAAETQA
ncbi:putative ATP-citrate synthase subunit 2 [Saitoella complicata NRRL Y-17804]|uniref:ATP citrate synthase n=1 Tax=Saitoella complicata (strain BCRC 22490 / CBS 7301 / JCM 7358 / NBRC 10748 / NRRL Y-17804) TaxID=698492 RepID=A0A0E9NET8_SAICN|nr:putative ATP-citrate synthase subunit 2 [Saitoella complicata NRRL Y-17804]ODQ56133.1 putative ATP-citrate synthase subunit 2 [Saitoella complicata NRRL Y-17804]GAO47905.1 hypothetical protein G7K_2101-t1 [Saitoella complicata NRRL Y-17804]